MNPLNNKSKKLIFEFKYIYVGKSELIQYDATEIDSREKGREEIEFLQERSMHNKIPGRTYDSLS